jgi:hypothetical protein
MKWVDGQWMWMDGWWLPGAVAPQLPLHNPGRTLVDAHLGRLSCWTNSEGSSIGEQQEVAR